MRDVIFGLCLLIFTANSASAQAVLDVSDGMLLWLDASQQPSDASPGWLDVSANKLLLLPPSPSARPTFVPAGKNKRPAAYRFDGKDDCFTIDPTGRLPLDQMTIALIAAPRGSAGGFPAMLSANASGKNDYRTGFNVDLGPYGTSRFDTINFEAAGGLGLVNLFVNHPATVGYETGGFHSIVVTVGDGRGGAGLILDGKPAGKRDRAAAKIFVDRITVGSRFYSNESTTPRHQGFFDGDVAEVILYDHVLGDKELASLDQYLDQKYATHKELDAIISAVPLPGTRPLVPVKDPPAVQVFVPGFYVHKLPLELTNLNNLRYRADGKLVALAYDGKVYLLSDSDHDGLEDRAETFWDNPDGKIQAPIGMALTPPGYAKGDGLFIASKGRLSLVVDTDKDAKADKEIVVASGWTPLPHGVDALGVALDEDGSIFFGLGTTNFANAYLIGPNGKAAYDLKSEHGTVMRVSPDFSRREIVATGIRFPVALAFNPVGDLFATDQEGATWLPNGNPFDELLHIRKGRHYGFPPRHPKYLPNVIDEPSVFDYRPQHQSTCGLTFNTSVNGGPVFGPASWANDALVTGYSRGKLWRTALVKSTAGYIARTQLFATAQMMPTDTAISPAGDLVVATHGGQPDWGTGPAGIGALFKISYPAQKDTAPQPLFAYAAGPHEVRIAYDAPLDPNSLKGLAANTSVEFGEAVAAGDRFETLRPGYEVVKRQMLAPRYAVDVAGVAMTPDRRTLLVQTAEMKMALGYALTLPGVNKPQRPNNSIAQVDATDLAFDLCGVQATWTPGDGAGTPLWTGWLPHLDLAVSNALTVGSAEHDALRELMKRKGVLRLTAQVDLKDMLHPAVQPISKLDYEPAPEDVTLVFSGNANVQVTKPDSATIASKDGNTTLTFSAPRQWVPLRVSIETHEAAPPIAPTLSYHTNEDPRPRAMPLRRILLPWAEPPGPDTIVAQDAEPKPIPELAGGNWSRGRAVFHSEQAMCAKCHVIRGDGVSHIGPDLSNLHYRDYESVLKDVLFPDAAINPDHIAYVITLTDGNIHGGVPRSDGKDFIVIGEPGGQETRVARTSIKSMEPMTTSIMPHGIDQVISKEALRDLMTYLLAPPLEPAKIEVKGVEPPPLRTRAELDSVLGNRAQAAPASKPGTKTTGQPPAPRTLHILLAAGPKDHGPGEHDYPLWQQRWKNLLGRAENIEIDTAFDWPRQKQFDTADVIIWFSNNPGWSKDKAPQLESFLSRGGGMIYLHYAVDGHDAPDVLAKYIGLSWKGGASKFRHGALDLTPPDPEHPITRHFTGTTFLDESYWQLVGDASRIHVLATSAEDGAAQPMMWTIEPLGPKKGRVFVNILGHYNWTFDDPLFRVLLLRGIAWCARDADIERLAPLAQEGARIEAASNP